MGLLDFPARRTFSLCKERKWFPNTASKLSNELLISHPHLLTSALWLLAVSAWGKCTG